MCTFLASILRRLLQCLLAAMLLLLYTPPEENQDKNQEENLVHQVQVHLASSGRCYVGALAGEKTVLWLQKTLSPLLDTSMNATLQQVLQCFNAAGVKDIPWIGSVTPQDLIFVLQGILLVFVLSWPLSVAYRLVMPFLRPVLKIVNGFLSTMAFIFGFKRFPFSMGKLKFKLKKKKKTEEKEEQGKTKGGCEKEEIKEKKSSVLKLFRRDKNKPTE